MPWMTRESRESARRDWRPLVGRLGPPAAGVLAFGVLWELIGRAEWLGTSFPALSSVVTFVADDTGRSDLLWRSLGPTLGSAGRGLALGAMLAIGAAAVAILMPLLGVAVARVSVILHSIPLIAFGPILITTAGREATPWIAAVLAAYYPVYVAVDSGFRFTPRGYYDLATVVGSTRRRTFQHLVMPNSIPAVIDGLRLGIPAALLGAVIGEWFGAPRGLGVVIVSSMQNYQIDQMWAAAVLGAACPIAAYAVLSPLQYLARRRFAW